MKAKVNVDIEAEVGRKDGGKSGTSAHRKSGRRKEASGRFGAEFRQDVRKGIDEAFEEEADYFHGYTNYYNIGYAEFRGGSVDSGERRRRESVSGSERGDFVPTREQRLVQHVFQPPDVYQRALGQLHRQRVLILRGRADIGKRTAAIKLMLDQPGDMRIHDLPPDARPLEAVDRRQARGDGFIVIGFQGAFAAKMTTRDWRRLANRMEQMDSFLVVSMEGQAQLPADLPPSMLCEIDLPTAGNYEMVNAHLQFFRAEVLELGNSAEVTPAAIESCLDEPLVNELLSGERLPPAQAHRLALGLWHHLSDGVPLATALAQFEGFADQAVREWFELKAIHTPDRPLTARQQLRERALRLTLAVFNGLEHTWFRRLHNELTDQLYDLYEVYEEEPDDSSEKKKRNSEKFENVFGRRESPLEAAEARLTMTRVALSYTTHNDIRVVQLKKPLFASALLKYIWQNDRYVELLDLLLNWLSEFGDAPVPVRSRAANALATLANYDFALVRDRVLRRWLAANDREHRDALSRVFGSLVMTDRRTTEVLTLLNHWTLHNDEALVWAAMRSWIRVGMRYTVWAMGAWRVIFERLRQHVDVPIDKDFVLRINFKSPMYESFMDAMLRLFGEALKQPPGIARNIYSSLLVALREWTLADKQPESCTKLGLDAFFALSLISLPTWEVGEETETLPPAVLAFVDERDLQDEYVRNLAWLLRHGLLDESLRSAVLEMLEEWVEYAGVNRVYFPKLLALFRVFISQPDVREREVRLLNTYLRRWFKRSRRQLPAAGELIKRLNLSADPIAL